MSIITDAARTIVPDRGDRPVPPLLIVLTITTGLVDAVSYLGLGRVFVANMTGNVVFLGFAIAGASGLSAVAWFVAQSMEVHVMPSIAFSAACSHVRSQGFGQACIPVLLRTLSY